MKELNSSIGSSVDENAQEASDISFFFDVCSKVLKTLADIIDVLLGTSEEKSVVNIDKNNRLVGDVEALIGVAVLETESGELLVDTSVMDLGSLFKSV